MKLTMLALIFAAALTAGPLTIQAQEAVWSNGLDTITLAPVTVDGPGVAPLVPYTISIADDPSSRTLAFGTQAALLGDSQAPITLRYNGLLNVVGGTYYLILAVAGQEFPHESGDGSRVTVSSAGAINTSGPSPATLTSTLNGSIGVAAPEPGAWMLMGLGLVAIGIRRAGISRSEKIPL